MDTKEQEKELNRRLLEAIEKKEQQLKQDLATIRAKSR